MELGWNVATKIWSVVFRLSTSTFISGIKASASLWLMGVAALTMIFLIDVSVGLCWVLTKREEMATNLKDASWLLRADQTSQLVAAAWYIEQRKSCWQAKQTVGSQEPQAFGEKYLSPEWPQPGTDFRRWLLSLMASTFSHTPFPQPTRDACVGNRDPTKERLCFCNFVLAASTEAAETSECRSYIASAFQLPQLIKFKREV